MTQTFERAKDGLAGLAFEVDGIPMDFEIVRYDYCFQPSLFPIPPKHASAEVYEALREALVEKLCGTIPSLWAMASLLLVGPHTKKSSPAIVVMVRPGSVYNWTELTSSIRDLVEQEQRKSSNLLMDIDVIIIPGDITSSASSLGSTAALVA